MSASKIDRLISSSRGLILFGLALLIPTFLIRSDFSTGALTGFALFNLGIYAQALRSWRTETGLWMLALLLALMMGSCWMAFEWENLRGVLKPAVPNLPPRPWIWTEISFRIDGGGSLLILGEIARLTISVAIMNWKLTRPFGVSDREKKSHGLL